MEPEVHAQGLPHLLRAAPPAIKHAEGWGDWFSSIAQVLLLSTRLQVNGRSIDLCEVEFYLHGDDHPDPYVHCDPMQRSVGQWYFHRAGESYRGGSFKGLDITFGSTGYYGGILIRSLRTPEGRLINGSSLCVDYLLSCSGHQSVSSLAATLAGHAVDASESALSLVSVTPGAQKKIWQTPRVGLGLARVAQAPQMVEYMSRPYRFLIDPRGIRKGRLQLVIALYEQGMDRQQIADLAGVPRRTVDAYASAYAVGLASEEVALPPPGNYMGPLGLCWLYGWLNARKRSRASLEHVPATGGPGR